MNTALDIDHTRAMFIHLAARIIAAKDQLTKADQAIGDGDHGIGMARGFEAVAAKLEGRSFTSVDELLTAIGTAVMSTAGGAAGAIFGTFFRGAAKAAKDCTQFDAGALAAMLCGGLEAVQARGKAKAGDKTMVDALIPAAEAAQNMASATLAEALTAAASAARQGMEDTKHMIATTGKSKTLGERSVGHPDPGAVSTYLMLEAMTDFLASRSSG